ncbi:Pr6Pr family membrane protein [Roseiarcaceae bacterium H3SJ34-1]|uniref:Pr6Pr family membrane protein n=1 Tax=Terripilifer ovatus TaxID=3032367 RepID=UPI003AB92705|nr:Pr6Pr family membrane protein [Roseiarcaceae bacterium H3SJ34-1]
MSNSARAAGGAVALVAWIGLAVQWRASTELAGSAAMAVWIMLRFFTIIANLIVAVVLSGFALGRQHFAAPRLLGAITLAILLVGVVYALLLRGLLELSGGAQLADVLLHKVTPILVPLFWLAFAPRGGLTFRDPWIWAILPLAYFAYALARGTMEGRYAYPFMDLAKLGWAQTVINAALIALGFVATGYVLVCLDGMMARSRK